MPPAVALRPLVRAVFGAALACGVVATPAVAAPKPVAKATPKPTPEPTLDPVSAQELKVRGLARERHRPAYAEGLLALAKVRRTAGDRPGALKAAREATAAFDTQVEMHKTLSDALPNFEEARAERAAAHALGLRRDEATFLGAELAAELGDADLAIKQYILVVQSQADQPLGRDAYAALRRLGWAATPSPAGSARP